MFNIVADEVSVTTFFNSVKSLAQNGCKSALTCTIFFGFQDHRTSGSGDDFQRFLPYMGVAAIFVM